ncbi:hypothetical protein BVG19_g2954 [[Candida] boidinii]|nr:hypothetical protein BVG19_g2954 [[Candida] boidinii]OWB50417.1 hypothetical protein B5S27_g1967 [[Candida] boidinii]OWB66603.1 hypothetical protein B5S30_g1945 [[Candida] boidinii]OWB83878.1 hypothetical protein B5S33_g2513 [[Candida] boidinii]
MSVTSSYTKEYEERLDSLLVDTPIVDTHNDFAWLIRAILHNQIYKFGFDFNSDKIISHTSIPKLRKGRVGVQFSSGFVECKDPDPLYKDFNTKTSVLRDTLEIFDLTKRICKDYPEHLKFVTSSDGALEAYKNGLIAMPLAIEGLHQIDGSLSVLRMFYDLGIRYATLNHNCDNPFSTAASTIAAGLPDNGLSRLGVDCIKEMNRLGIMVDLSHTSYKTMNDVLDVTEAPVIFSHSCAWELTHHERNVRDDVLLRLKENNGVIQICFYGAFITSSKDDPEYATIDDLINHIFYIAELIGWEYVGFGGDYDGMEVTPVGLEDTSKYPDVIYKCMERGATDDQIRGLMGGNLLRVWKNVEVCSEHIKREQFPDGRVVESEWEGREWEFFDYLKDINDIFKDSKKIYWDKTKFLPGKDH